MNDPFPSGDPATGPRRRLLARHLTPVVAMAAIAVLVSACGSSSSNTLAAIQKSKQVTEGFANEAPYAYADSSGNLVGAGSALAAAIFKQMGIKSESGVLTQFSGLIPGLQTSRFDIVVALPNITPPRCKQVIFSDPVTAYQEALAVKAGNPKGLNNYNDIASKGAKLGILQGGAELQQAQADHVKNIAQFPDQVSLLQALSAGRVDAVALTAASLKYGVQNSGVKGIEVTKGFVPPGGAPVGGFAFRTSDTKLRDAFNAKLEPMLKNGKAAKLMSPYLTQDDINQALKTTTAKACGQ
jgi:polar amino acid transport system substrate-binding protein